MDACQNQQKKLVMYVHGELGSNSGKEIENHLASCKFCRSEHQQLLSLLGNIKASTASPDLSPKQVNSLVTNIKWKLKDRNKESLWQRYLDFRPAHMIPAIAAACILIIAAGVIGYMMNEDANEFQSVAGRQIEELVLSDSDLEIVKNLELLREMDAIQKLSQVVDLNGKINSQRELDSETRGMKRDVYRNYFV